MAIKFSCPHCKTGITVKNDSLAGKRGACPKCKKMVTIPQPAPEPAPVAAAPDLDVEALASEAFAESKTAVQAPEFIDMTCPMCDAAVRFPYELGGKRAQCPECKNIVKVDAPKKKDEDWRKTDNLPTGARRDVEPVPEGAWTAQSTLVGREALEEAGALRADPRRALTLGQKIQRGLIAAAVLFAVVIGGIVGYRTWAGGKQDDLVVRAVAQAGEGKSKEAGAVVHRAVGEYWLRSNKRDCGVKAKEHFDKARELLVNSPPGATRDLLLVDLALSELGLAGDAAAIDAGKRLKWEDVQRPLTNTLSPRHLNSSTWARVHAIRTVTRRLLELSQGATAFGLVTQFAAEGGTPAEASEPYEGAELLAVAGLEFHKAGDKAKAEQLLNQATQRKTLAPSLVTLALVLTNKEPAAGGGAAEADILAIGRAEGLARRENVAGARAAVPQETSTETRLRALNGVAAHDATALDDALQFAKSAAEGRNVSAWAVYRLASLLRDAGRFDDATAIAATAIDPALKARAQAEVVKARLAASQEKADPKMAETVDATQPAAAGLAFEALARRNVALGMAPAEVEGWRDDGRAAALAGAALGAQDKGR